MEVSCHLREFSKKWDKKLSKLLEEGVVTGISEHNITFKLEKSRSIEKSWLFWSKEVVSYDHYQVWVSNKDCSYGKLYSFNNVTLANYIQYSASQDTLVKLLKLERELNNPLTTQAYN